MSKRPKIERRNGRIYFEGPEWWSEFWSVTDPEAPENESSYRALARDWHYIICVCPDTKTALEKVSLIRWALWNVERPHAQKEPR